MTRETSGNRVRRGESGTRSPVAPRGAIGAVRDEDVRYKPWTTGIAWVDDVLVFVAYGPREFRALWGGGANQYNDFLVRRQQVIAYHQESWPPSQMVPIPFDFEPDPPHLRLVK